MKKLLSAVLVTAGLATGAFANTTVKAGIYAGGGLGHWQDKEYSQINGTFRSYETGFFADAVKGHFYAGTNIGVGKVKFHARFYNVLAVTGKLGLHFDALKGLNIYGLAKGYYGSKDDVDVASMGYGIGTNFYITKHWGLEIDYIHSNDNFIFTDYIESDGSYPSIETYTNRGEAFIKYSF